MKLEHLVSFCKIYAEYIEETHNSVIRFIIYYITCKH